MQVGLTFEQYLPQDNEPTADAEKMVELISVPLQQLLQLSTDEFWAEVSRSTSLSACLASYLQHTRRVLVWSYMICSLKNLVANLTCQKSGSVIHSLITNIATLPNLWLCLQKSSRLIHAIHFQRNEVEIRAIKIDVDNEAADIPRVSSMLFRQQCVLLMWRQCTLAATRLSYHIVLKGEQVSCTGIGRSPLSFSMA